MQLVVSWSNTDPDAEAPPSDPYWSYTSLLLHGDGTHGSTTFIDECGKTVTSPSGNAQIITSDYKFGTGCIDFINHADGRLDVADNADWNFGAGDFTIEFWVKQISMRASNAQAIVNKRTDSGVRGPFAILIPTNTRKVQLLLAKTTASYDVNIQTPGNVLASDTWNHVACVRSGTNVYLFVNGVLEASSTLSGALVVNTDPLRFGDTATGTDLSFGGRLDEIRITKGVARYTTNFTPPTEAFAAT